MKKLIQHLTSPEFLRGAPTFQKYLHPQEALFETKPRRFHTEIKSALKHSGIEKLYQHQSEALDVIGKSQNPLIVTPTASGKSLIYQLAILEELQRDPGARALLIFPLKSLEQGMDIGCISEEHTYEIQ